MDIDHNEVWVTYLGKKVPVSSFRAFVYSKDDQKLVNSWDEFQEAMASGVWFAEKKDISSEQPKPRKRANKKGD